MTDRDGLDRVLARWLASEAEAPTPRSLLPAVTTAIAGRRPSGRWRARWVASLADDPPRRLPALPTIMPARRTALAVGCGLLALAVLAGPLAGGGTGTARNGWIAFANEPSHTGDEVPSAVHLVREGVEPFVISEGLRAVCPAFSPDGTLLAYGSGRVEGDGTGAGDALVILEVDEPGVTGTRSRFELAGAASAPCARWSPQGDRLAFARGRELVILGLDGSMTQMPAIVGGRSDAWSWPFEWSPDGTAIALTAPGETWLVPVDGGQPRVLRNNPYPRTDVRGTSSWLSWSPDGTRIALDHWYDDHLEASGIVIMNLAGDLPEVALEPLSQLPVWSPDGEWLAYLGQDEGLTFVRPDGTGRIVVGGGLISWSPDGRSVLQRDYDQMATIGRPGTPSGRTIVASGMPKWNHVTWPDRRDVSWQKLP